MKKLLKNIIPLVTPTMIALAIYIAFRPTSAESANYGGGRIIYGGGGGGFTHEDLVTISNIAASLASSPTGGVALTAFNQLQLYTNGAQVGIRNGALVTNLFILGPDGGIFLTLSNGTFSPTINYGSGDNEGFIANNYSFGDNLNGSTYVFSHEVSTNEFRWLNNAQNPILTLYQNRSVGIFLTSNTLVSVAPGGILSTTIIGANLSYDAATRTLSASGGVGNWFGQNAATNVIITNSTSSSATSLVLSNSTGNQLDTISFYHGSAAPDTSLSFDILAGSNTFRLFPGPLTSFPPFLTMDRMNRNLMLGYGGAVSLTSISNVADTHFPSNAYFYGSATFSGNSAGSIGLKGTNELQVKVQAANSNSFHTTNIIGTIELAAGTPTFLDANFGNNFVVTNRIGAATTFVLTNTAPGQEITLVVAGEASGGTDRIVTVVAHLGQLITDLDTFGTALATSTAQTVTNGNAVEYSFRIVRQLGASNFVNKVSQQYKF